MKTLDLTINYQSNAPEDSLWVRLEQEGLEDDVATLEDTANFIDEAYSMEACAEEPTSEEPTEESISEAVKEVFDYSICKSDYDGSINVRVRVVRSDISFPYTVHIAGGEILSTEIISEEIISEVFIESGTSVVLNYPVISEGNFYWLSDLVSSGDYSINRKGTTLYWSSVSSGTIKTIYATTYDVLNIKVYGVDGEYGKATVRVVYQGNIDDLETEIPESAENDRSLCNGSVTIIIKEDKVTCYKAVTANQLCSCSKDIVNTYSYEKIVECPDWVSRCPGTATDCMALIGSETVNEYVECAGDNQVSGTSRIWDVSSPEFYKKTCCEDPGFALPQCYEKTTSYRGGQPISYGQQFWRDLYGPLTRFVPVSPEGGECGKHITQQVVQSGNCCEGVPPLAWDGEVSPEIMAPNSAVNIGVTGGRPPYTWSVAGSGFQFQNGAKKITTTTAQVQLSALVAACGSADVNVSDGCTVAVGSIRCSAGRWVEVGSFSPSAVALALGWIFTIYDRTCPGINPMITPAHRYEGKYYLDPGIGNYPLDGYLTYSCINAASMENIAGRGFIDPVVGKFWWPFCHAAGWNAARGWYRTWICSPSPNVMIKEWQC